MESKKLVAEIVAVSFTLIVTIAIFFYENYNFFEQYLSELGIGQNGIIFNVGLMITSVLLLVLYYLLFFKKSKIDFLIGFISSIALFGVGLFPMSIIAPPHFLSAAIFFIFSLFLIAKNTISYYYLNKKIDFIGAISLIIIVLYILIFKNPIMQKLAVFVIILWLISIVFFKK